MQPIFAVLIAVGIFVLGLGFIALLWLLKEKGEFE